MSKLNKKRETFSQETEEEEDLTGLIAVEAGSDEEFDDGNYYHYQVWLKFPGILGFKKISH